MQSPGLQETGGQTSCAIAPVLDNQVILDQAPVDSHDARRPAMDPFPPTSTIGTVPGSPHVIKVESDSDLETVFYDHDPHCAL